MATKRIAYFDVLNIAACFCVIAMHFNGLVHSFSPTVAWAQALFVECLAYWAVPIFFMLSGATLLRYRERYSTREFLKKRFTRTFVPFLLWSLIALVWKVATRQLPAPQGPRTIINLIFMTQIIDIYWFFIPLFAIYLAIPVLSLLADGKHDNVLWYALGVSFITISVLPCLLPLMGIQFNPSLSFPLMQGYLMFPVLGYLLSKTEFSKAARRTIYVLGLLGFATRLVSTLVISPQIGQLYQVFWGLTNFPTVFLSVAVFVFFKQVNWNRFISTEKRARAISKIASCSFGIYLLHMFFFYHALQITGLDGGRLLWRVVMPFVAYFACLATTYAIKQVPLLRKIIP